RKTWSSILDLLSYARVGLPVEWPDSVDRGVDHEASCACWSGHDTTMPSELPASFALILRSRCASTEPPHVVAAGVTHPVQSLPDVRRTEARRAGINRPDGVTRTFQVRLNKVEPSKSVLARNLLAKDCERAALVDEMVERGP